MNIEVEPFGGIAVRWRWLAADAYLLFDPVGAWWVWRGRLVSRVQVGVA